MNLFRNIREVSQGFLGIIIPPTCLSCSDVVEEQGQICGECWPDMHLIGKYKCSKCGLPFEFDMGKNAKCQDCAKSKPKYKKVIAATKHDGVARKLAINLKFNDRTQLAPYMASMMINMGREILEKSDLIIPVPLHRRRQFFRKYNQSAVLANEVSKQTGIEYNPFILRRTKPTTPQTRLTKKEREKNVKDAFSLGGWKVDSEKSEANEARPLRPKSHAALELMIYAENWWRLTLPRLKT